VCVIVYIVNDRLFTRVGFKGRGVYTPPKHAIGCNQKRCLSGLREVSRIKNVDNQQLLVK